MTDEPEDPDPPENLWDPSPATTVRMGPSTIARDAGAGSSGPTCTASGSHSPAPDWRGWPWDCAHEGSRVDCQASRCARCAGKLTDPTRKSLNKPNAIRH